MLAELTVQLVARPGRAWPQLVEQARTDQARSAGSSQGTLPSPLRHALIVAWFSVIATGVGAMFRPGATVGGVTLQTLAALLGYAGGAALAVLCTARWLGSLPDAHDASARISRFASGAVVPVAASGVPNVWLASGATARLQGLPWFSISFALALAGAAVSVHSGWVGASAMLTLEGQPRTRAAAVPAGLAVGLVLLATAARTVLPS